MTPFRIGLGDRRLDRLDIGLRRLEAAELLGVGLAEFIEDCRVAARLGQLVVALARLGQRTNLAHFLGQRDRMLDQLALGDAIDQAGVVGVLGRDHRAGSAHFERLLHASHARQPLRATRSGQQAKLHLGHAELRVLDRDPIMAAERHLEPAAQRGAMDRCNHRLRTILDRVDHRRQPGHDRRLAELGNVGAGEKGLAFAPDDDSLDRLVAFGLFDRRDQSLPNRRAKRIHRRVVRRDDQDVAMAAGGNRAGGGLVDHVRHRTFLQIIAGERSLKVIKFTEKGAFLRVRCDLKAGWAMVIGLAARRMSAIYDSEETVGQRKAHVVVRP